MDTEKILAKIIELDKEIATLQDSFELKPEKERLNALVNRNRSLLTQIKSDDVIDPEIIRIAEMMCTLENAAELLAEGLSHENEELRSIFGEALISIGNEEGVDAILPAIDYSLEKLDISAFEMPFILTWIDDPNISAQVHRFLHVDDPRIICAAIEACTQISDPDSIEVLTPLLEDQRLVELEDDEVEDENASPITIAAFAKEAIEMIEDVED